MKKIHLFALLITVVCSLQACHNSDKKENSGTMASDSTLDTVGRETNLNEDETGFIQQAAVGGMMEVELGNKALQKSQNAKVKAFAQMMVKDHTQANAELSRLAVNKGLQLPATFPAAEQKHLDDMEEFSGKGFDKQYMEMMVSDHIKTLELFRKAAAFADPDISAFANKTIPVLETHSKAANALNTELQKEKANNGDDNANVERDQKKN